MRVGFDEKVSKRGRGRALESGGARDGPERRDAFRSGHERVEIELDRRARPRSGAIDDAERAAVADDGPPRLRGEPAPYRAAPRVRRRLRPGNGDQHAAWRQGRDQSVCNRCGGGAIVTQQLQQRDDGRVEDGARARCRPERAGCQLPPAHEMPFEHRHLRAIDPWQHALLEIRVRDQPSAESRNHLRCSGHAAISSERDASTDNGDVTLRSVRSSAASRRSATALRASAPASARPSKSDR